MKTFLEYKTESFILTAFLFIAALLNTNVFAQTAGIDSAFNPLLTQDVTGNYTGNFALQPDGKIIIFGAFSNSPPSGFVKRLNADGSLDTSFNCAVCENLEVRNAILQPDGKVIVAANSINVAFVRLNTDGSLDQSFNTSITIVSGGTASADVYGLQPDGKIIIRYYAYYNNGFHTDNITRLNTNGSIDTTFNPISYGGSIISTNFSKALVLPDGKILAAFVVSSGTSNLYLYRYNADGTQDTTFERPTFGFGINNDLSLYADGRIIFSGAFTSVNSLNKRDLVRLFAAGNVDTGFTASANIFETTDIRGGNVKVLADGKSLFSTAPYSGGSPNPNANNRLYRLNTDGSVDNTFNPPSQLTRINSFITDSSNRILVFGVYSGITRFLRLNSDGSLDSTFNFSGLLKPGNLTTLAVQANGKLLVNGNFNRVGGVLKNSFARLNQDGTLDNSFDSGTGFNVFPKVIVPQTDGKILVGGSFTSYNGVSRNRLARLNSDGSLDIPFNPNLDNTVNTITLQTDGKILIGGDFVNVNGVGQRALARLNSDGSADTNFNPLFANGNLNTITLQTDGKILAGGSFSGVNGFSRWNLVRLNSDGTLDSAFNPAVSTVNAIVRQTDGKYLIMSGNSRIERLNIDGTNDLTFQILTNSGGLKTIYLQPNGKIIVGGSFSSPKQNIFRLFSNGTLDANFIPQGANAAVNAFAAQSDGSLIVGGVFSQINSVNRYGIARIGFSAPTTLFDYDGDGRADVSVFRPSENRWYVFRSSDGTVSQQVFAVAGDKPVPADFDGDGKTDIAIFRASGDWWSLSSSNNAQITANLGNSNDIKLPSDFDGDGRADYIIFRPSNNVWYRLSSATGTSSNVTFGLAGDKPVSGDFDGDGKSDVAIYRPSTGDWWYQSSINGAQLATRWGIASDIPTPADFDGDGKTDFAVYRASTGVWYIYNSSNGSATIMNFGLAEDKPVAADYDGDGKADIAVFRPSTGIWYLMRSTAGFTALQFGISTDIPTQNAFVP